MIVSMTLENSCSKDFLNSQFMNFPQYRNVAPTFSFRTSGGMCCKRCNVSKTQKLFYITF